MCKVSIIIPVYNTEKYLKKCLDSVQNQTLQDIEVICVDDGSTDGSCRIIDEYVQKDNRFRVIHKDNGGLVSARKAGARIVSGQYIGYVDSDDWIEPEMFESLYGTAVQNDADMVSSGYIFEGNYITAHYDGIPEGLYDETNMTFLRENSIFNLALEDVGLRGSLCCKLFRRELLKAAQEEVSDRISFSEDKMCVLSCILQCLRVYVMKQAFYHYISHKSSMVHGRDAGYLASVNEVYQHLIKLYGCPGFTPSMQMQAELYITELLYKGINSRLGFENKNLLWLDPYYLSQIPKGAKIVLYGGGELGDAYRRQLSGRNDLELAGCVDPAYATIRQEGIRICSPKKLTEWEYDIVLIAIKNREKADAVKVELESMGIAREKICWFEQKEIFWKYAEVNGWLQPYVNQYKKNNGGNRDESA